MRCDVIRLLSLKCFSLFLRQPPNGVRYPLVGGTRERCFVGTNFEPPKVPENAQTPTTMAPAYFAGDRVHYYPGALSGRCVGRFSHLTSTIL